MTITIKVRALVGMKIVISTSHAAQYEKCGLWYIVLAHLACADPEGGTGGPDPPPPWNLKILPKKR